MTWLKELKNNFYHSLIDDSQRIGKQFIWIYGILFVVSAFMSVVNLFTAKTTLMWATVLFALLCVVNIALAKSGEAGLKASSLLLAIEIIALFIFFIVSGMPEGFSAIWICMLPSSGMLLFQRRNGSLISALMFAVLLFFFRTALGQSLLQYRYTDSFMLRFPMLYLAFFAISFFLETVRSLTYDKMKKLQTQYEYLYAHDALTGLYNRYGFNERLEKLAKESNGKPAALMILDIDHFKNVNDRYGHVSGDAVLRQISDFFTQICEPKADICRWGGEEFAILYADGRNAEQKAEQIRLALQALPLQLRDAEIRVTVSIGVAVEALCASSDTEKLVTVADQCLFAAKRNGRNQTVCKTLPAQETARAFTA